MLVELNVVEQRYAAVLEVLNEGVSVAEVAARAGVTRQTVHRWLRNYARDGLAGLVDRSSAPVSCPHQMDSVVEARIVALRQEHPGWGPRTLGHQLGREGFDRVPGRSSIYRCLVRHHLIEVASLGRVRSRTAHPAAMPMAMPTAAVTPSPPALRRTGRA